MNASDKAKFAYKLRLEGLTYANIAYEIGCNLPYARDLALKGLKLSEPGIPHENAIKMLAEARNIP